MGTINGVTPILEVALTATMFATAPTWTDLIAGGRKVERVEWERGQSGTSSQDEVGRLRIDVSNTDNALDPDNASGPYYPNLARNRQIRFRGTNGSTYDQFSGWVDRIVVNDEPGQVPTVSIYAIDALGLADRDKEATVGFRHKVLTWSPAPTAYWRLGDSDSFSVAYDETGNRRHATYAKAERLRMEGGLVADGNAAADMGSADGLILGTSHAGLSGSGGCGLFFLVYPRDTGGRTLFYQDVGSGNEVFVQTNVGGTVTLGNSGSATTTLAVTPNAWNAIAVRRAAGGGTNWFLRLRREDGSVDDISFAGLSGSLQANVPIFGGDLVPGYAATLDGGLDELVIWSSSDPGETMFATLPSLALNPGDFDWGLTRVGSTLDRISYPSSWRTVTYELPYEAWGAMLPHTSAPSSALAVLQKVADTQGGKVYTTRDRKIAYEGYRFPTTSSPTPAASFSDDDTAIPITSLKAEARADLKQFDRVVASDGTHQVVVGTTPTNGSPADLSLDIYPGAYRDLTADSALRRYRKVSTLTPAIESLVVHFQDLTDTQRQTVLGLDRGSVIQVTRHPSGGGTRTHLGEIRQIKGRVTDEEWVLEFATVPVPTTYVPFARASRSVHTTITTGTSTAMALPGERWDTDQMFSSQITAGGFLFLVETTLNARQNDRLLVLYQGWWATPSTTGVRAITLDDSTDTHARLTDVPSSASESVAHQVGVLHQNASAGLSLKAKVRQTSGGNLEHWSSALGDANWAFSPEFTAVRFPAAAHAGRATKSVSASIGSTSSPGAGQTLIQWDGADRFDVGSSHDPASNNSRVTAQKSASFFYLLNTSFAASATGSRMASIRRNGTQTIGRGGTLPVSGEETSFSTSSVWKMTSGDYVEALAWQDTGAGLNLVKSGLYSPEFMWAELVQSTRAHKTSSPSLNGATDYQITFESEVWDDAGCFTAGADFMTVQWTGPTLIWGGVSWFGNATGMRSVWFTVNDVVVCKQVTAALSSGAETPQTPWTMWDCKTGDVVKMFVRQTSGGALTLQAQADYATDLAIAEIATGP